MRVRTKDIQNHIESKLRELYKNGRTYVDIRAGDIIKERSIKQTTPQF